MTMKTVRKGGYWMVISVLYLRKKTFCGLKKNKSYTENIPAATQLFAPHWIVKYW